MRPFIPVLLAFAFALVALVRAQPSSSEPHWLLQIRTPQHFDAQVFEQIDVYRHRTWHWQRVMGRARTPYANSARESNNPDYHRWVRDLWRQRWKRTRHVAARPPHRRAWLCIHRHEGHWKDPNPPYYGGLQMDVTFQRRYGGWLLRRKGTANRWTPVEQMWVAERAYRSGRGFYPWPNTARYCGLL